MTDRSRLEGKRALVTGGSSGIGAAIVCGLAREGAKVAFTYRSRKAEALALADELEASGHKACAFPAELDRTDTLDGVFGAVVERMESIDVLVNNAAEITRTGFLELTLAEVSRVFRTNFVAPFRLTQLFCRACVELEQPGSVVNVSSVSADSAISRMAHYQSSKAALAMLTKSVAYEMAPHGIRVNTISPGLTATGANRDQWEGEPDLWRERATPIPLGRAGVPDDHVGAVIFLASDEASWVTGANLVIDGGSSTI